MRNDIINWSRIEGNSRRYSMDRVFSVKSAERKNANDTTQTEYIHFYTDILE
jgi:hypothetical protein